MDEVKKFLDKPMHEMTVKDNLIVHATTVFISIAIPTVLQGVGYLLNRRKYQDEEFA